MAGIVAVRAKIRLFALLTASPDLTGVQVAYSFPGSTLKRECVYGGKITGPVKVLTMVSETRAAYREDLVLHVHTEVATPGESDTAAAELRAAEIGSVLENLVAGNPELDGSVDGLQMIHVTSASIDSGVDDDGAIALLTQQLTIVGLTS